MLFLFVFVVFRVLRYHQLHGLLLGCIWVFWLHLFYVYVGLFLGPKHREDVLNFCQYDIFLFFPPLITILNSKFLFWLLFFPLWVLVIVLCVKQQALISCDSSSLSYFLVQTFVKAVSRPFVVLITLDYRCDRP